MSNKLHDDACYFVDLLYEPISTCSPKQISKLDLCVKEDMVCFDTNKLGNNELVDSYYLIDIDNACFTTNHVDLFDDKVQLMKEEEEESQVEEKECIWEAQGNMEEEEMMGHKESQSEPPTLPPQLVLKLLLTNLEYAFLGKIDTLPVVISSKLDTTQKKALVEVFKDNKEAIAWKLSDMKGISPTLCTHKIFMDDDYKLVVQPQWRLNPKMSAMVKGEVVRLRDVNIIYPISDSLWVTTRM